MIISKRKKHSRNALVAKIKDAQLTGAGKTQKNNVAAARRFARILYDLGYKVRKWSNVRNNHVATVIDHWKELGHTTATIKSYLSGTRTVAKALGNDRIHDDFSKFGIERRKYVTNRPKTVPDNVYKKVLDELLKGPERYQRIARQIIVMRALGLRHEEARKMNPKTALLPDGRIYISAGTKGGRDRQLHNPTQEQIAAVKNLAPFIGRHGNSWPDKLKESSWEKYVYKTISALGLSIKKCGASLHGLRHQFALERYKALTEIQAPCLFNTPHNFRDAIYEQHGSDWKDVHDCAVNILAHELGHNRSEITAAYIGSTCN